MKAFDDSLTTEAQEAYEDVISQGFYWNLIMTDRTTYAGIRRNVLSDTIVHVRIGPNELSKAVIMAYEKFEDGICLKS